MTNDISSAFGGLHMLIVDDDPMAVDILSSHYQRQGMKTAAAPDGAQAMLRLEERKPDVVLCDRVMPGMSGAELLSAVRARSGPEGDHPEWRDIIFIFITALTDRRDKYSMMPLQPDGYLCKPIKLADADRAIMQCLQRRRSM